MWGNLLRERLLPHIRLGREAPRTLARVRVGGCNKKQDKVIWQNIRDRDNADGFSITFVFQAQVYKNFMCQLQKAAAMEK